MTKQTTLDDLAGMVQKGFDDTKAELDEFRGEVTKKFEGVDKQFEGVIKRLDVLEDGQEQIKLKLDNVAYRFELVELQRRVEILEKKAGIKN